MRSFPNYIFAIIIVISSIRLLNWQLSLRESRIKRLGSIRRPYVMPIGLARSFYAPFNIRATIRLGFVTVRGAIEM